MSAELPPELVRVDGVQRRVRRAWPAGKAGIAVELEPRDGTGAPGSAADVSAGWWRNRQLELCPPRTDPKLPRLAEVAGSPGAEAGRIVSHRPGKRAVFRTPDSRFIKVLRHRRAATVLGGIARAETFAASFRMPAVLDFDASSVTFAALPGRSLHHSHGWDPAEWKRAWTEILEAWLHAVTRPPRRAADSSTHDDPAHDVTVHDAAAEVAVLDRWFTAAHGAGAVPTGPASTGTLEIARQEVTAELVAGVADPLRVIHRDLHDQQLLWGRDCGPGLLDVDTATLGEPSLDLGNLRAHAQWRCLQQLWTPSQTAVVTAIIDRVGEKEPGSPARVATYERAALIRLACVHGFRPSDRPAVRSLTRLIGRSRAMAS